MSGGGKLGLGCFPLVRVSVIGVASRSCLILVLETVLERGFDGAGDIISRGGVNCSRGGE